MVKRRRALSELGCELFNISFDNEMPTQKGCFDFRTIFNNIMTTDFDIKLKKNENQMIKATIKMFSFLHEKQQKHIGKLINNAITNIIIFILTDGENLCSLPQIKMNINFYVNLADNLYKSGDHNSAIIIRAALNNGSLKKLKLKSKSKHEKIFDKFNKEYGTFLNLHADHLRKILDNNDCEKFFPSLMVLMMHLNKTKEYVKSYQSIGKLPVTLSDKVKELTTIADIYYNRYRDSKELLLQLYTSNSLSHPIMKKYKCFNEKRIPITLHQFASDIIGKKNTKTNKRHSI